MKAPSQPSPTNLNDELDSIMLKYMHGSGWNGHIEADVYQDAKREIMSAITTAYAEAIWSAVPEKRGKIYRGGVKGDEKVYVATTDWQDAFNEAIDIFTDNLKNQGLLPNGKDE